MRDLSALQRNPPHPELNLLFGAEAGRSGRPEKLGKNFVIFGRPSHIIPDISDKSSILTSFSRCGYQVLERGLHEPHPDETRIRGRNPNHERAASAARNTAQNLPSGPRRARARHPRSASASSRDEARRGRLRAGGERGAAGRGEHPQPPDRTSGGAARAALVAAGGPARPGRTGRASRDTTVQHLTLGPVNGGSARPLPPVPPEWHRRLASGGECVLPEAVPR